MLPSQKPAGTFDKEWFLARLKDAGTNQSELAGHLGRDRSAVSKMFKGERKIKAHEVTMLAQLLGVGVDEIIAHAQGKGAVSAGFAEMKQAGFDKDAKTAGSQAQHGRKPLPSIFGSMKGTTIVMPGVDLTEPADPDWGKVYED